MRGSGASRRERYALAVDIQRPTYLSLVFAELQQDQQSQANTTKGKETVDSDVEARLLQAVVAL
jgi:hypothetical protein